MIKVPQIHLNKDLSPCMVFCPLTNQIPLWLKLFEQNKIEEAYKVILERNPFPAILGRVCYHTCESQCNRAIYDRAIGIHQIETMIGDYASQRRYSFGMPALSKKQTVLIVGSGPAGLSAAFYLRKLGYKVVVAERESIAGGMMYYGIPAFRLPKEIVARELDRLQATKIKIICNCLIKDLMVERKRYDAIFLAIGANLSKKVDLDIDLERVEDALSFLKRVVLKSIPRLGRSIAVYGGGNTAMDVARTLIGLGYQVTVIYHRTPERIAAFKEEIFKAKDEGVKILFLRSVESFRNRKLILRINTCDMNGEIKSTGLTEMLVVDYLITALSQEPDINFLRAIPLLGWRADGSLQVDQNLMTTLPGVFAGGDLLPGKRNLTSAVAHGYQAALSINFYLNEKKQLKSEKNRQNTVNFNQLNLPAYPVKTRLKFPSKVNEIFSDKLALQEAERCLSCGYCLGCGRCIKVCPCQALEILQGRVVNIDKAKCIGCGKCVKVCPVGWLRLAK